MSLCVLCYRPSVPVYFHNYLISVPNNSLITRNRGYFDEPFSILASFGKNSVKFQASHLCNNLILNPPSNDFNLEMSFANFKSLIHAHLLQSQNCIFPSTIGHQIGPAL
jgi:hypothetical protein